MTVQRRTWLGMGVAALAAAAGAGVAWRRYSPEPVVSEAEAAFWTTVLTDPEGKELDLRSFQGRPLLVNFWATWCPPCVEELPMLNAFYEANKARGWQVVGLAVDQRAAVQTFMQRLPLAFPVGMAGIGGVDLSRQLGNANGALPFTVVFDGAGRVRHQKIGKVSLSDLENWAKLS
ncbi:MAG: TlpA disulfide reductase family protein [Hydrogenophaga sp.]